MAQEQEQLAKDMEEMKLNGSKYTDELKMIRETMKKMTKNNYGMKEDPDFACPFTVSRGSIDKVDLQRKKEIHDIHTKMALLLKLCVKVNRDIDNNQKTTYRLSMLKMRNKTNESVEKKRKNHRVIETNRKNKLRNEENIMPGLEAFVANKKGRKDDKDEDDDEMNFT
jgi:hypothetical protein